MCRFSHSATRSAAAAALAAFTLLLPARFAAAADAADKVTIPERTEVKLSLKKELKSGDVKEGAEVPFEVVRDVLGSKNELLIRAGTPAYGKVTESKRRGILGKPGKLNFTCDYIRVADGTRIPLRSQSLASKGKDNQTAAIATAVFLAPIAIFMNGKDVTMKEGTEFAMFIDANTTVPNPANAPSGGGAAGGGSSAGKSVFLLNDGTVIVGALVSFNGASYVVTTDNGEKTLKVSDVKSVTPIK